LRGRRDWINIEGVMRWDNEEDEDEGGEGEGVNRDIDTTTLCPVRAIPAWRK